jgi:hypothetical protein
LGQGANTAAGNGGDAEEDIEVEEGQIASVVTVQPQGNAATKQQAPAQQQQQQQKPADAGAAQLKPAAGTISKLMQGGGAPSNATKPGKQLLGTAIYAALLATCSCDIHVYATMPHCNCAMVYSGKVCCKSTVHVLPQACICYGYFI